MTARHKPEEHNLMIQQQRETSSASAQEALYTYWTTEPMSHWQLIPDTPSERDKAIKQGARLFTALSVDKAVEDGNEPKYYGPLCLDFDCADDLGKAHRDAITFVRLLQVQDVPVERLRIHASGSKGFHVEIPPRMLGLSEPVSQLPAIMKEMVKGLTDGHELETLDCNIYSGGKGRMWRIPNLRRQNGRYKVPLTAQELLHLSADDIRALTESPRQVDFVEEDRTEVPALVEAFAEATNLVEGRYRLEQSLPPELGDDVPPCLELLATGKFKQSQGQFNHLALTMAGYAAMKKMQDSKFEEWTKGLADGFKASATYKTEQKRLRHLLDLKRYAQQNIRYAKFDCRFVKALKITEVAACCRQCALARVPGDMPQIMVTGDMPSMAAQATDALMKANDPPRLFQRGGTLVRVRKGDDSDLSLELLNLDSLRGYLARCAEFIEVKKDSKPKVVPPPLFVVRDILAAPTWPFPVLYGIVRNPYIGEGGNLVVHPGYHAAERVWLDPGDLVVPPVPDAPSSDDVRRAVCLLRDDLLVNFPFEDESSFAHTVAMLLLPAVRSLIKGPTPLHLVTSPQAGTGKGLLVDVVVTVTMGRPPSVLTEAASEEEWRKRITATLMEARQVIRIDNVSREGLYSSHLSAVLTSEIWEDRVLGQSKTVRLPNRALWVATGNNVDCSVEIGRRTIRIGLDARMEKPWLRKDFKHDNLRQWAYDHRPELVAAVLTIARAWVTAGMPVSQHFLGSFEAWSGIMGGILEVAGIPGFLGDSSLHLGYSTEEDADKRGFVEAWWHRYDRKMVGVEQLFGLVQEKGLLLQVLGEGTERSRRTRLGKELGRMRNQVISGHRIEAAGSDHSGRQLYRLRRQLDLLPASLTEHTSEQPKQT
jgi:hypothetical protein